jgi:Putative 2OG-Fe(II) oxygenase
MATQKPQIRNMFPTPVCVHFLPIAQEVNAELRPLVLDKMAVNGTTDLRGRGWHSASDFDNWGGAAAQTLFRVVRELADALTATRTGARIALEWKVTACASVRQKGDYAELSARPGAMWSGVYFVDDGYAKSDEEALWGECEFADPRGALPVMVAPQLSFRIPGGASAGHVEAIRPQTGMIVLHPSWLARGERRFEGTGPRVTIEFDLLPP